MLEVGFLCVVDVHELLGIAVDQRKPAALHLYHDAVARTKRVAGILKRKLDACRLVWLEGLGVPFAAIQARVAMLSELVGGTLLALGLFTRPAALLLVGTMIVAGRLGHRGAGYLITNDPPGAEYTINLAAICLVAALIGPGAYSIDALIF